MRPSSDAFFETNWIQAHLKTVGEVVNGKLFEELKTENIKLASTTYKKLRYDTVEDDPVNVYETAGAKIVVDHKTEDPKAAIDAAFAKILDDANKNGSLHPGKSGFLPCWKRLGMSPDSTLSGFPC